MRTVTILGKAPRAGTSVEGEVWACNDLQTSLPEGWSFDAWDRWFDLHTDAHIKKHRPLAWAWYQTSDGRRPIYLHRPYVEISGSVAYPRNDIQTLFSVDDDPFEYFTSSIDWMLALAISTGVGRIILHGVDLWDAPHERGDQRCGAHYWIGVARGRGICVDIPHESSLCKATRLYGWFTSTSDKNFSSVSLDRFLEQVREARLMQSPGYVAPGLDTAEIVELAPAPVSQPLNDRVE
jgi:hypothetical protein|tara:strand:- start:41 stop:751 length:711 start_codon:yes stop_codon:yes gene_type:complete